MVALTIRNIDPDLKREIKKLAAAHDCSMEAEAHELLKRAILAVLPQRNVGKSMRDRVKRYGALELEIEPRMEMPRDLPDFGE